MLAEPGSPLRAFHLAACLGVALLACACATRGSRAEGWITVSEQVRYRTTPLAGRSLRLEVAYLSSAMSADEAAQQAARDAFRRVAIDLGDPAFDPDQLARAEETEPSGVRAITVAGAVAP
jgi:hypothetical protein